MCYFRIYLLICIVISQRVNKGVVGLSTVSRPSLAAERTDNRRTTDGRVTDRGIPLKVAHMGWNDIHVVKESPLIISLPEQSREPIEPIIVFGEPIIWSALPSL